MSRRRVGVKLSDIVGVTSQLLLGWVITTLPNPGTLAIQIAVAASTDICGKLLSKGAAGLERDSSWLLEYSLTEVARLIPKGRRSLWQVAPIFLI